jgi:hypothetical protein
VPSDARFARAASREWGRCRLISADFRWLCGSRRTASRSAFAIARLLLCEALGGRLKPRAKADVHLAPGRLDRGELQKGAAFLAASKRNLQWQSRIAHHREHNIERRAARQLEFGQERRAKGCGPFVWRALFAPSAAFAGA